MKNKILSLALIAAGAVGCKPESNDQSKEIMLNQEISQRLGLTSLIGVGDFQPLNENNLNGYAKLSEREGMDENGNLYNEKILYLPNDKKLLVIYDGYDPSYKANELQRSLLRDGVIDFASLTNEGSAGLGFPRYSKNESDNGIKYIPTDSDVSDQLMGIIAQDVFDYVKKNN